MFVRCKKRGDRVSVQIVKSVREGNKVRQRVLRHVGTATSEVQLDQLKRLGQTIIGELRHQAPPQPGLFTPRQDNDLLAQQRRATADPEPFGASITDCRLKSRISVGIRDALGEMYSLMGWDSLLDPRRMSANRMLRKMVLARIADPLGEDPPVRKLDRAYGTIGFDDEEIFGKICRQSMAMAERLHGKPVSAVFYDITTLHFAGEYEDSRVDKVYANPRPARFEFALLATPEGIPCGYRLFPGNAYEGHTLIDTLDALSRDCPTARPTLVADPDMLGDEIRKCLDERAIPYVPDARAGKGSAAMRERIFAPDDLPVWQETDGFEDVIDCGRPAEDDSRGVAITRSIRHKTRLRAHIAICYMAHCCLQHLRHRLEVRGWPMTPDTIRRELETVEILILAEEGTSRKFALPGRISLEARRIYSALGIRWNTAPFPIQTRLPQPEQTR